jgi:small-conductance mechanosensitive channel
MPADSARTAQAICFDSANACTSLLGALHALANLFWQSEEKRPNRAGTNRVRDLNLFDRLVDNNWELAALAVIVVVAWSVGTRCFGGRSIVRMFPRIAAFVELLLAPIGVIVVGSLTRVLLQHVGVRGMDDPVRTLTIVCVYLAIAWVLARVVEVLIVSKSTKDVGTSLQGLQRSLLYGGSLLVGITVFLVANDFSITGLYVSTGAIAALIGFAMQRTLGDLFSGIALSAEHPFRLGDWIELRDGAIGRVIDVNWRATRLLGFDNSTLVIPNGELASQGFKNLHGSDHLYAPWYEIRISSEVEPRFVKALLLDATLRCEKVLRHPLPVVRLSNASTVPYTYMIWVHFPNYLAMFAGREDLYREIHYALSRAGIQIAPELHEIHTRKAEIVRAEPPTVLLALKGLDLASGLTDEELQNIASKSQYFVYDVGTVLLKEGAIAEGFDIVVNGVVESSIALSEGSRKVVERLSPGQYFGITSMIIGNPSFLQFTALTDVTLIRIDIECLRSVLAARPGLSEKIAGVVKQRLDRAEEVRLTAKQPVARLTIQDILRRIEKSLRA